MLSYQPDSTKVESGERDVTVSTELEVMICLLLLRLRIGEDELLSSVSLGSVLLGKFLVIGLMEPLVDRTGAVRYANAMVLSSIAGSCLEAEGDASLEELMLISSSSISPMVGSRAG